jgi:4-hydroxybenzoate polyprenyltransferase
MAVAHDFTGMDSEPIGDAPRRNWVDRFAPARLRPWLRLIRADRPIGVWLLLWPCWWSLALAARATNDVPDLYYLILFAIGAYAMRSAGCIYNDILDRDIDAQVGRTRARPLAAGQISVKSAVVFMMALCSVGLWVLLQFNPFAIALGFASVGLVLVYPLMKRITFWPQAVLGLAFGWGALMGWTASFASVAIPTLLLYAATVSWIIGYDTIYAHQDREDDASIGLKSTALKFGEATKVWLAGFYGFTIVALAAAGWIVGARWVFLLFLAAAALQFAWQITTLRVDDAENCLVRFRSNTWIGFLVFMGLTLDSVVLELLY